MDFANAARSLNRCRIFRAAAGGKSLHSHLAKSGMLADAFIANNLVVMYDDLGLLDEARQVFVEMPHRNVVSWTTMISSYSYAGMPSEALHLFSWMLELNLEKPNNFTFSAALKACALREDIEVGKLIHRHILGGQMQCDTILMNSLLDMYVKCRRLSDAKGVFSGISFPNMTSWNTLIAGYCNEGLMDEAVSLFYRIPEPDIISWNTVISGYARIESKQALEFMCMMQKYGIKFDDFTLPCILNTCASLKFIIVGEQIHSFVVKSGIGVDQYVSSALIDMYSKCGKVRQALNLFNEYLSHGVFTHDRRAALWSSMISGCAANGYNAAALVLVSQLHKSGTVLNSYIFGSVLKVCVNLIHLRCGLQVHGLIVSSGYHIDSIVGSALIEFYAKCVSIENAMQIFRRLPKKDAFAWCGMISCSAKLGSSSLVFSLFREMLNMNIEVDHFIASSVLTSCSSLAALESGQQLHAYCIKSGYESETVINTSLIDMYSKCGEIDDGMALFENSNERDTACWTGIIVGCGLNGRTKEAIEFFHTMLEKGVKPNDITFLGILSACRHAGLVGEARKIFSSMAIDHAIVPGLEHYCCMVDLLGQVGCFEEAERLISDMPYELDESIWQCLLGACRIHNNVELAKRIAKHLISESLNDASIHVILSNICASLGMWDCSTKLREEVREVCMKDAGKSWIRSLS